MTHEELRALLAPYAAGALDDETSQAVRAHLASGCLACLDELFGHPVGLPRANVPETPTPAPPPAPSRAGLLSAIFGLSMALATAVGWMIVELRGREIAARDEAASVKDRLDDAEIARAGLAARRDALEREVTMAREDASRRAEATREAVEERARLGEELAAARERIATLSRALTRRTAELDALRPGLEGRDALHEVVGTPGVDVLRLHPVAPFRDVRGHALWQPRGDTVVLYAFNLPPLATGHAYRARLTVDEGRVVSGPALTLYRDEATTVIRLDPRTAVLQAIEVTLDPPGTPILSWRRSAG